MFLLLLLFLACTKPQPVVRDPTRADLELEAVTVRTYTGGTLQVVTHADRLQVFREVGTPGDLIAHDAGVLLVRDGTWLTAPRVQGNLQAGHLVGTGGVHLTGQNNLRATTPWVAFDRTLGAAGQVSSDAGVWLSQPGLTTTAAGFEFDLAEERATFDHAVSDFSATQTPR